jgi:hypothetical protein
LTNLFFGYDCLMSVKCKHDSCKHVGDHDHHTCKCTNCQWIRIGIQTKQEKLFRSLAYKGRIDLRSSKSDIKRTRCLQMEVLS